MGYVWSNFLNYNKDLGDNSSFSATLGQEAADHLQRHADYGFRRAADPNLQYITSARNAVPSIGRLLPTDNVADVVFCSGQL
ncbi:MAG: hypothetical protein WKG07_16390 [Hymenobacter sp.]